MCVHMFYSTEVHSNGQNLMKWIEFFSFDWITRSANREWYFYYNNLIMFIAFFSLSLSSAGVLDAQTGPPHFDVGHPHVHRRSAVLGAPSAGLGRLGPQNWVRPAEGQRHLRVPGQHGTEDQPGDSAGRYRLVDLKKNALFTNFSFNQTDFCQI